MSTDTQPRRALIVIDVQNEYIDGDLPIEYPDARLSLRNILRAMDAARAHGIPVIVVQNSAPENSPIFARGSRGWQLHPSIAQRPRELEIDKTLPSAFAGTNLEAWLAQQEIDTLSVVGYMTHNCVDSTVKHALHAGTGAEVLYDATGSVSYANRAGAASAEQIHRSFAVVMQSRFAAVTSTAAWLGLIERGERAERDGIYASNQRARMQL